MCKYQDHSVLTISYAIETPAGQMMQIERENHWMPFNTALSYFASVNPRFCVLVYLEMPKGVSVKVQEKAASMSKSNLMTNIIRDCSAASKIMQRETMEWSKSLPTAKDIMNILQKRVALKEVEYRVFAGTGARMDCS